MSRRSSWASAVLVGAAAIPLAVATLPAAAATGHGKAAVRGSVPAWARPADLAGHANPHQQLTLRVGLAPRDQAGLQAFDDAVSDPSNRSYGQYLTPAQYRERFAPTADQVAAVRSFLSGAGLTVTGQTEFGDAVTATGTVAQVESAFGTTLGTYRHGGKSLRAPEAPAQVPDSLAGVILSVGGLTDTSAAMHPTTVGPDGTTKPAQVATPCSSYYGQNSVPNLPTLDNKGTTSYLTAICGYHPDQIRGAYGLANDSAALGTDGKGQTVAIIDAYASPTMLSDLNAYSAQFGLPQVSGTQYTEVLPGAFTDQAACGPDGWAGEETLDVEAVHSMAPAANIVYVASSSCDDLAFLDAYSRILGPKGSNSPLARLVSNSYGDSSDLLPNDLNDQTHAYFQQAVAEGVGFYFSSGDSGDAAAENNGVAQPQASANDPLVTAVGGTTLGVRKDNSYEFETGWGNTRTYLVQSGKTQSWLSVPGDFYAGAGGGTSTVWAEPRYQQKVVPAALAKTAGNQGPGRVVPDVAAVADPYTGFEIGQTTAGKKGPEFTLGSIGGTSLASPVFTGYMAVAQQRAGRVLGFANPMLYSLGSGAFHDVQSPVGQDQSELVYYSAAAGLTRLVTADTDTSLQTARGYDDVTGLGSPNGAALIDAIVAYRH